MKMIYDYKNTHKTYGLYNKISHSVDMFFDTWEEARDTLAFIELNEYDIGEYEIVGLVRYKREERIIWN